MGGPFCGRLRSRSSKLRSPAWGSAILWSGSSAPRAPGRRAAPAPRRSPSTPQGGPHWPFLAAGRGKAVGRLLFSCTGAGGHECGTRQALLAGRCLCSLGSRRRRSSRAGPSEQQGALLLDATTTVFGDANVAGVVEGAMEEGSSHA